MYLRDSSIRYRGPLGWQCQWRKISPSCSLSTFPATPAPNILNNADPPIEKYPDFESCQICLKCTNCSAKIWIRSDPANRDYAVRSGATKKRQVAVSKKRNYQVAVSKKRRREAEEGGDALKSLDNTTLGSKREIAALDEMKSMESQHATVSVDATLEDSPTKVAKRV